MDIIAPGTIIPHAVVEEGVLSDAECDRILEACASLTDGESTGCGSVIMEFPETLLPSLESILAFTKAANDMWWRYDLQIPVGYLQVYEPGAHYSLHTDGGMGQTRKLTTIAMVTPPEAYEGGVLTIAPGDTEAVAVPRTRGTLATFTNWTPHGVSTISAGHRKTINLGMWGAEFKP